MSRKPELRGRAARLARLLPAGGARAARTPFVLLVVLLLGGGLIGLLVLNSALSEGSFRLDDLQRDTKSLTDEEQALQRDVDTYSAPDALQRRARELGMVPGGDPAFLNPDGSVKGVPGTAAQQSSARNPVVRPPEVLALTQTASPQTASPAPATSAPAAAVPSVDAATPQTVPPRSLPPQTMLPRIPTPQPPAPTPSAQPSSTPGR
ncbi:septum formation initiator family protein [Streptomyces sp. NBC_01340]|uniref:septum formation initiator family protein n=1 Tax=unclassified Streptomyces TaxID=2593676 RepID=UPI00224F8422|nr:MULTISPECIES: septum formation initiator family protein [unclassified Streptomyces]MCX4453532.1 septum formation initiator family protein [Streptomyces sp. NBC_01719]MCX4492892.1 septum formation initiator family protein [Streptomyces sp. NBC_01728]WSI38051.1 septum formation initiator family protein [Streptomyces sp. NBC_01340]